MDEDGTETKSVKQLDNERRAELYRLMDGVEEETVEENPSDDLLPVFPERRGLRPAKSLKRVFKQLDLKPTRPAEPTEHRKARSSITVKHYHEILTIQLVPGTYEEIEDDLIKALMFLKEHSRRYLKLGNSVDISLSLSRPERAK